jgi:sporulation protein YlmC with PRC-barrel domain
LSWNTGTDSGRSEMIGENVLDSLPFLQASYITTGSGRNTMKFSELKGRAVINLEDATKLGTIEDLMVDSESHHIVSIKVRTGLFQTPQIIPVADVKNVGGDAVTISTGGMANITGLASSAAQQQIAASQGSSIEGTTTSAIMTPTASTVPPVAPVSVGSQSPIEITSLLGNSVITDAGTMVGDLSDVMIDWVDLTITGYEVRSGGPFTKAQEFVDTSGVRYGNKLITLPAELLNHPN